MAKNEATLLIRIKQAGGEVLDKIGSSLSAVAATAGVVGTAIVAFGTAALKSFREQELATNQLSQAMVQQGVYSTELRKKYEEMASSLQKVSTFGDEQIISAQAQLQAFVGQREVTQDLVKATLDLAAAKNMDLSAAAALVGKTINSETKEIRGLGIEVDVTADKQKRMESVVKGLNSAFGGQAEAATKGLGAFTVLKNTASDFMEEVGGRLAPVVTALARDFQAFTLSIMNNKSIMDAIISVFQGFAQTGIVVKNIFVGLGQVIGNVLAGAFGSISSAIEGNFREAWNNAKSIVTVSMADISATYAQTKDEMRRIDDLFLEGVAENQKNEEDLIRASNERKKQIAIEQKASMDEFVDTSRAEEIEKAALYEQIKTDQQAMAELTRLNNKIATANTELERLQAIKAKEELLKKQQDQLEMNRLTGMQKFKAMVNTQEVQDTQATLGTISSLQNSNNKALVAAGKAAAIANITISTAQGVAKAWSLGPLLGPILAGLVVAAGAAQVATVAGVKLAEGGIVKASPGGTSAIIGEGGSDEAVIPLDDPEAQARLGGGNVTVVFNGPVLGDDAQAMEFAKVIDRSLLRLRQSNQSVAFDSDVI